MKFKISDLWRIDGKIGRGPYLIVGLLLFAVKYNLDRIVAGVFFQRNWGIVNYWMQSDSPDIGGIPSTQVSFYAAMLATALPFIWIGVCMTLARLRDSGLPLWMTVLFFVPLINLIFFLMLGALPAECRTMDLKSIDGHLFYRSCKRWIPDSPLGSAGVGIGITLVLGGVLTCWSVEFLKNYGWGLFVGVPFCLGLFSVLIYGFHVPRSFSACVTVSVLSVVIFGIVLLALAMEGIICIAMAAPIAIVLALIGGTIGWVIQRRPALRVETPRILSVIALAIPAMMAIEKAERPEPPLFEVKTAVVINAPPLRVWKNVVSFTDLPEPTEWVFRTGVAYPTRAEIRGKGIGAIRHCNFSTGCFIEPIEVWDEPRLLKFSVTSNPPPMKEISFYPDLHPPHLDGYLVSRRGQFHLIPLPGGRTLLEGTTWYQHGLWPVNYWRIWSDQIIHAIHQRVLKHVKQLSEKDEAKSESS